MENISIIISIAMFVLGALADLVVFGVVFFMFWKILKIKTVIIENNQEIYEHDRTLNKLAKEVEEIKQG